MKNNGDNDIKLLWKTWKFAKILNSYHLSQNDKIEAHQRKSVKTMKFKRNG